MNKDTVLTLKKPVPVVEDALKKILRTGAQQLLAKALKTDVDDFVRRFDERKDSSGRRLVVRNGYLPERTIQPGLGDIPAKAPRVADKSKDTSTKKGKNVRYWARSTFTFGLTEYTSKLEWKMLRNTCL